MSLADLTPEKRKEIAKMGAKALHDLGLAHKFTSEEAKIAGKLGGIRSGEVRRSKLKDKSDG